MGRGYCWLCLLLFLNVPAFAETYLILPFYNASKKPNLDWVGESISESIREALATEGLIVIDGNDRREAYRRLSLRPNAQLTKASVFVVGEALDADQALFGSFELSTLGGGATPKSRGTLRITAQIFDLKNLTHGPEYMELGQLEDLARLQTHLAWQTLQFLTPKSAPSEQEFLQREPVIRVEAIESFVRGLLATSMDQRIALFQKSIQLEPKYSQANFELGRLQWTRKNWKAGLEAFQGVSREDDHYREALFMLGLCLFHLGDFAGAESAFREVSIAIPLSEVWNDLGAAQLRRNSPAAVQSFEKALEGDAADADYQFNLAYALYRQGNLAAAAERFRAVLERNPDDAEAGRLLNRCVQKIAARPVELKTETLERLKNNYEEAAYRQLKAVLEPKR